MPKASNETKAAQLPEWRERFPEGTTFYIVRRGRTEGGRDYFDVFTINQQKFPGDKPYPRRVSSTLGEICGWTYNRKKECLQVNCGGGLAQHVEYELTKALIPANEIKPRHFHFHVWEMD